MLEGSKCELSELRSSAYAAVHRLQQALREHGAAPTTLPDGCEPSSVPQQLKGAVDALLAMLQVYLCGDCASCSSVLVQKAAPAIWQTPH